MNESIRTQSDIFDDIQIEKIKKKSRYKRTNTNNLRTNIIAPVQSLKQPLEILSPIPNQVMAKLGQFVDENGSSNHMLINLFPTIESNVILFDELQFFDQRPAESIEFNENNNYDVSDDMNIELPIKINSEYKSIRQSASGYVIKKVLDDNHNDNDDISYWYLV